MTFKCPYCGGSFCQEHRLLENHNCKGPKYARSKAEPTKLEMLSFKSLQPQKPFPLPAVRGTAAKEELKEVMRLEKEFDQYLSDLVDNRLYKVVGFGKNYSILELAIYLRSMFGPTLFFDSLLTITQQCSIADVEIISESGSTAGRTGFNLALFGHPGTGKTFAAYDMICGKPHKGIPAHGLPGRNRYCGGMTPARFIEIGQAYEGRKFNFIVTEFNDWFKYRGMVEPLKLAMERGTIKKETYRETIGPYKFSSFFSVNYNVAVKERSYRTTATDPNFNAIEDRMLCRLHRLTRDRYQDIAKSQKALALGKMKMNPKIRDYLTLIYAIETKHPYVKEEFPYKKVLLTEQVYDKIEEARNVILEHLKYKESLDFSPRLEWRSIQFACAASILSYFKMPKEKELISIDPWAIHLAIRFYVEEASVRSKQEFKPEYVLFDLGIHKAEEEWAFKSRK